MKQGKHKTRSLSDLQVVLVFSTRDNTFCFHQIRDSHNKLSVLRSPLNIGKLMYFDGLAVQISESSGFTELLYDFQIEIYNNKISWSKFL